MAYAIGSEPLRTWSTCTTLHFFLRTTLHLNHENKTYDNLGWDSTVSASTCYGLDDLGIESQWGQIFHTHPDLPWGQPSLLYNAYQISFLGVKWLGCGTDHPPPMRAEAKDRVELYLYSASGPSWPVIGWTSTLCTQQSLNIWGTVNIQVFADVMLCNSVQNTASHPRDHRSSASQLWECQIFFFV